MGIKGKRCQLKWSKVISLFAIIVRLVFIKRYSEIIMSIFCSQRKITWNFIKNQKDSLNLLFIEKKHNYRMLSYGISWVFFLHHAA